MKKSGTLILAALLIITGALSAGCTGSKQTTPVKNTPQTTQTATEATPVPVETATPGSQTDEELKPGDEVSSATVTNNDFTWYEYRINQTAELPPAGLVQFISIEKTEYSNAEYNGEPAILAKITYSSISQGWSSVSELYYDKSKRMMLCGTRIMTTRDNEIEISTYPPEEVDSGNSGYFGKDIILTYQGSKVVTVPAGTYSDARKYTYYNTYNKVEYAYWFSPNIPVPVLVQFLHRGLGPNGFESRELMGWG